MGLIRTFAPMLAVVLTPTMNLEAAFGYPRNCKEPLGSKYIPRIGLFTLWGGGVRFTSASFRYL